MREAAIGWDLRAKAGIGINGGKVGVKGAPEDSTQGIVSLANIVGDTQGAVDKCIDLVRIDGEEAQALVRQIRRIHDEILGGDPEEKHTV